MQIGTQKVLIVDDDMLQRRAIELSLRVRNRVFLHASDGDEAILIATREKPDVIVTDYHMPHMNGIEFAERIRSNPFTAHTPMLMVSGENDPKERVRMIRAGVDDVVLKPYNPEELAARVDMIVARCQRELGTDSLTRLPGNQLTLEQIERRLASGRPFALAYLDIDQFKPFVDRYGYERAAQAIITTARVIERAIREFGHPSDFVGHIAGDDFVLLLASEHARLVCDQAIALFTHRIPDLYDERDRLRGYIDSYDREGIPRTFPLMTLSVVLVHCRGTHSSSEVLASVVARLKADAKAIAGHAIVEGNVHP
ncbi:MAG: GGDEF domain-containing response regulator [Candidatus Zipacnadales bacterium]